MLTRLLRLVPFLVILSGCGNVVVDAPEPGTGTTTLPEPEDDPFLKKSSFHLPTEGTPNDNKAIGPFCCTGTTAVVEAKDGYPVGYVYFYTWEGQAYTNGDTSFAPDVSIQVAGLEDAHDAQSKLIKSQIAWKASEMTVGSARSEQAGDVIFTANIEHVDTHGDSSGTTYFDMSTLAVRVDISVASAGD